METADRHTVGPQGIQASGGASRADLAAARLLLQRLGVSPQELLAASDLLLLRTFAEYVPVVSAAVSAGTRRVYCYDWDRILERWGERRLDEVRPSEIGQFVEQLKEQVVLRRNARGGRSTAEHLISALRCIYNHAVADELLGQADDPSRRVQLPRRLPSTRRALPASLVTEMHRVAATTGNDPELDALILRLHEQTACRREGGLALLPQDLDPEHCLVLLREKAGSVRWQPVTPSLMADLQQHARERQSPVDAELLRYKDGRPIGRRRYDYIWTRLGKHIPLVARHQVTTHWLRYTTLTWVERNFGYAVARAFAGHNDRHDEAGSTATYVRASVEEVATALAAMTGEKHPLAGRNAHSTVPGKLRSMFNYPIKNCLRD